MSADFSSLRNYFERQVFEAVVEAAPSYPLLTTEQLPDVACVALNHLPTRYIRHEVDLVFYLTEKERADNETAIAEAVRYACEFVQARFAMRARR